MDDFKLIIDISYYNWLTKAQWDLLRPQIDGLIIRLSFGINLDVMAEAHVAKANELGLPFIGYHWVDPNRSHTAQLATYLKAVDLFKPRGMYNDYEQYWSDWAAYMSQNYAEALRTKYSPSQINDFNLGWHVATSKALAIPVGSYSADWFIDKYSPAMKEWVFNTNYWEARYLQYYDPVFLATKKKEWGIPFDIGHVRELLAGAPIVKGIGRQVISYLEVKGLEWNNWHMDYSRFTNEGYARMFNTTYVPPIVEPPITLPPSTTKKYRVVGTPWVNVRSSPNGAIIRGKLGGAIVEVPLLLNGLPDIMYGWAHILPQGWIYMKYLAQIYE